MQPGCRTSIRGEEAAANEPAHAACRRHHRAPATDRGGGVPGAGRPLPSTWLQPRRADRGRRRALARQPLLAAAPPPWRQASHVRGHGGDGPGSGHGRRGVRRRRSERHPRPLRLAHRGGSSAARPSGLLRRRGRRRRPVPRHMAATGQRHADQPHHGRRRPRGSRSRPCDRRCGYRGLLVPRDPHRSPDQGARHRARRGGAGHVRGGQRACAATRGQRTGPRHGREQPRVPALPATRQAHA